MISPLVAYLTLVIPYQGSEISIQQLLHDLQAKERMVRIRAAQALAKLGPKAKAAVPSLLKAYRVEQYDNLLAKAIELALIKIGRAAVPALVVELNDSKSPIRASVIVILGEMGAEAAGSISTLSRMLDNEQLSFLAAKSLLRIDRKNMKAVPALLQEMQKPRSEGQDLEAAELLIRAGHAKQTIPFLIKALEKKEDPFVVAGIARLLWEIGPEAKVAVPLLTQRTVKLAPRMGFLTPYMVGALLKLKPGDPTAIRVARKWTAVTYELLLPNDPLFGLDLVQILGPEAKDAAPSVEKLLKDKNPAIRKAATEALRALRRER